MSCFSLIFWTNTLLKTTCWYWLSFHFHIWIKSSSTAQQSRKATFRETQLGSHGCIVSKLYGIIKIATVNLEKRDVIMRVTAYWGRTHLLSQNLCSNPDWPIDQGVGFVSSPKEDICRTTSQLQLTASLCWLGGKRLPSTELTPLLEKKGAKAMKRRFTVKARRLESFHRH